MRLVVQIISVVSILLWLIHGCEPPWNVIDCDLQWYTHAGRPVDILPSKMPKVSQEKAQLLVFNFPYIYPGYTCKNVNSCDVYGANLLEYTGLWTSTDTTVMFVCCVRTLPPPEGSEYTADETAVQCIQGCLMRMFQPVSPQPFYLEAIAEELAQIGDEFNREFGEHARERFSAQEFIQVLDEVTGYDRASADEDEPSRIRTIFKYSVILSFCVGLTIAWFVYRVR